ncbi:hypothetical protein [Nocardioides sp.]|uniref:hypothetical protein n=1 Tax=Nocardioides sp. TaxID=35761 RepID=UPI0031FF2423|nr:hypothetical protein [Nocardioides sp.]
MFVRLDLYDDEPAPTLCEPDDFLGLKVVLYGPYHLDSAGDALAPAGTFVDGDTALLSVEELRRLAGHRADDEAWSSGFAGMLGYASSKGWLDADGTAVTAHCEWRLCPPDDAHPPLDLVGERAAGDPAT